MQRRDFIGAAIASIGWAAWPAGRARAMGGDERIRFAALSSPGQRPDAARVGGLRRLLQEVERRTSVQIEPSVPLLSLRDSIFAYPLMAWFGEGEVAPWSAAERERLGAWLRAGGTLLIDSSEGLNDGPFARSAARELSAALPGSGQGEALERGHVLYKSFYLVDRAHGRVDATPELRAWDHQGRAAAVMSENDLVGAWARDGFGRWEFDVDGGPHQREMAIRLGVNIVLYALCVNYKADQVHVPFILKRRKWRVE